jgi:hypothetical protein
MCMQPRYWLTGVPGVKAGFSKKLVFHHLEYRSKSFILLKGMAEAIGHCYGHSLGVLGGKRGNTRCATYPIIQPVFKV